MEKWRKEVSHSLGPSRRTIRADLISAGLVLAAHVLLWTSVMDRFGMVDSILSFLLLGSALCIWLLQVRRRLIHTAARRYFLAGGIFTLLLILVRTWKYAFFWKTGLVAENNWLMRYIWYLYYVLELLFATCFFLGVLSAGEPSRQSRPNSLNWRHLVWGFSVLLCILILANDRHQLMFRFLQPDLPWNDIYPYSYGILYVITLIWLISLFLVTTVVSLVRCASSERAAQIWKPLVPVSFSIVYILLLFLASDFPTTEILKFPDMLCLFNATFTETLILARLIPSNDNYHRLWNASSIRGGIMDQKGRILLHSDNSPGVTPDQVRQALSREISLKESGSGRVFLLGSMSIQGGYAYWTRDVSGIRSRRKKLEEMGDILLEENVLLEAENRLQQEKTAAQEQNELYQQLSREVQKQTEQIRILLQKAGEQTREDQFQAVMAHACVLNAYVKRRSNLFLAGKNNNTLSTDELVLAMEESVRYLRFAGIRAELSVQGEGPCPGERLLKAYEFMEDIIEASLEQLHEITIKMQVSKPLIQMEIETSDAESRSRKYSYHI